MINDIANKYNFKDITLYGNSMAKVDNEDKFGKGKIILVTATNPTKYGEGKTTVAIGLTDALNKIGYKTIASLREPSLGPVFGLKGGATGGGCAKIIPENEINLHFTGDFHAITSANNLICAVIDNEIYYNNKLDIQEVTFNRCIDMNDRALRKIKLSNRDEYFDITAASEIMAILCLAKNKEDLKERLNDIIIGYNSNLNPIYLKSLNITNALIGLLETSFKPNIVSTLEGNASLVHGGPFANIAHGCSSITSLKVATNHADYVITEAGFGADAGAFKFMDILTRDNNINLAAIVLVTTVRALKYNGNDDIKKGILNLEAHINNLKLMNNNIIVTINKFESDKKDDIEFIKEYCKSLNVEVIENDVYLSGSLGGINLAKKVIEFEKSDIRYLYDLEDNLYDKIDSYVKNICHADGFNCSMELMKKINEYDKYKYPICVAKTQYSLSDDKDMLGSPKNYKMTLTDIKIKNGAKLIVCYFGKILTMPGLNENPCAKEIKYIDEKLILPH